MCCEAKGKDTCVWSLQCKVSKFAMKPNWTEADLMRELWYKVTYNYGMYLNSIFQTFNLSTWFSWCLTWLVYIKVTNLLAPCICNLFLVFMCDVHAYSVL